MTRTTPKGTGVPDGAAIEREILHLLVIRPTTYRDLAEKVLPDGEEPYPRVVDAALAALKRRGFATFCKPDRKWKATTEGRRSLEIGRVLTLQLADDDRVAVWAALQAMVHDNHAAQDALTLAQMDAAERLLGVLDAEIEKDKKV